MSRKMGGHNGRDHDSYQREMNTAERLMRMHGLDERDARIVAETVPIRGTPAWDYRESVRLRIGSSCFAMGPL